MGRLAVLKEKTRESSFKCKHMLLIFMVIKNAHLKSLMLPLSSFMFWG